MSINVHDTIISLFRFRFINQPSKALHKHTLTVKVEDMLHITCNALT